MCLTVCVDWLNNVLAAQAKRAWWKFAVRSIILDIREAVAAAKKQIWLESKVLDRYMGLYIRRLQSSVPLELAALSKVRYARMIGWLVGWLSACGRHRHLPSLFGRMAFPASVPPCLIASSGRRRRG